MKRGVNINREPISSEEIESFKDFKSILKKHAQTTEDLAKIKPTSSNKWVWLMNGFIAAAVLSSITYFVMVPDENPTQEPESNVQSNKNIAPITITEKVKDVPTWNVLFSSTDISIAEFLNIHEFDVDRIEYKEVKNSEEIMSLIPDISVQDAEYALNSKVFKGVNGGNVMLNANQDLFQLQNHQWVKVDHLPFQKKEFLKPRPMEPNKSAYKPRFEVKDFPELKEYQNCYWQPVNEADVAEDFSNMVWEKVSIKKTNIQGVYNLVWENASENNVVKFYAYPVLVGNEYSKALKEYQSLLVQEEDRIKKAPKKYVLEEGIFLVK